MCQKINQKIDHSLHLNEVLENYMVKGQFLYYQRMKKYITELEFKNKNINVFWTSTFSKYGLFFVFIKIKNKNKYG